MMKNSLSYWFHPGTCFHLDEISCRVLLSPLFRKPWGFSEVEAYEAEVGGMWMVLSLLLWEGGPRKGVFSVAGQGLVSS